MTGLTSLPPAYFDGLYAADPDPWRFETSDYERAKYDATLDALPSRIFTAGLEVGCSIGVLTSRLAERCSSLLAVDVSAAALARARQRCADLPQVSFRRMQVPEEWPDGRFDLIVLSEVLYYLAPEAVACVASLVRASVATDGAVIMVHYTLPTNYPLGGDAATACFIERAGLAVSRQMRAPEYRIDLLIGG